jgi:hypothetical protein
LVLFYSENGDKVSLQNAQIFRVLYFELRTMDEIKITYSGGGGGGGGGGSMIKLILGKRQTL